MATYFIIIIYLAFISLGLPDSLLGAAWPVMQLDYGAPLDMAGWLFMSIAAGTIVSSLASGAVIRRFGTGKVTLVSCLMTACALIGFGMAPSVMWLFVFAIPLGLGGGSVDAALNNYVAAYYKAHHMNWLHCFWGVGATLSPMIMAQFMAGDSSWRQGYLTISGIQFVLVVILLLSLPLWDKVASSTASAIKEGPDSRNVKDLSEDETVKPLHIRGVKLSLAAFLFYCGVEATLGLWGSSFLVNEKSAAPDMAAQAISLYFAGITLGRFIAGFITFKLSNRALIRAGQITALSGTLLLCLPLSSGFSVAAFMLVGLGLAPIYPSMLHETPLRFGKKHSQTIMGYQMAIAYTGSTFIPPLLGYMASSLTIGILPLFILISVAAMVFSSERLNAFFSMKHALDNSEAKSPLL
ncbi:MFS transporter [Paenibacillus sp. P96]|uniref:MFS transporter n=1 Tax=Paenibacillus zeirhizosphaerae TaxID=2987519 RepID=A0ABT9FSC8_9BACL|nr:MFS transporter [Paenibacillus sp. P96]MDP4097621.1 MFS transporter [Paenibacillus sp. P96]